MLIIVRLLKSPWLVIGLVTFDKSDWLFVDDEELFSTEKSSWLLVIDQPVPVVMIQAEVLLSG